MSDWTIVNFLEIDEESTAEVDGIEGRFGRTKLNSRDLGVSLWRYAPNFRSPVSHRHHEQEEAYVVTAGSGRVRLDDEVHELRHWDVVRCAPGVLRAFEGGPEGLELVAIGGPKPEGGDGEMSQEPWPDDAGA